MEAMFPFDEPESTRYAIVVDGEVAGMIQWGDGSDDEHTRHAYIDIFVGDSFAGRGIGTEAIKQLTRMLHTEHGYHRFTLDPAIENEPGIRAYEKAGFRRIGITVGSYREHQSGRWRDELMMELVLTPPAPPERRP